VFLDYVLIIKFFNIGC